MTLDQDPWAPEELHPDLVPHLTTTDGAAPMACLHHPLIVSVPYSPQLNKMLNAQYAHKTAALSKAFQAGDRNAFVYLHERHYRIQALHHIIGSGWLHDPANYWPLVASVWTDSENIWQNLQLWRQLWSRHATNRHEAMDDNERAALEALPETITIFRGVRDPSHFKGLSWTTDEAKAHWFANRFSSPNNGLTPRVIRGRIHKRHVLAHFLNRGESEIVCLPQFASTSKDALK